MRNDPRLVSPPPSRHAHTQPHTPTMSILSAAPYSHPHGHRVAYPPSTPPLSDTPLPQQHPHSHSSFCSSYYTTSVCAHPQPTPPPHQPTSWPPADPSPHAHLPPPTSYPYLPPAAPPHQYVLLPPMRPPYMLTPAYAPPPQHPTTTTHSIVQTHSHLPTSRLPQVVPPSTVQPVLPTPYYIPHPHYMLPQLTPKKRRLQWTPHLHAKFVKAVERYGIDQVVPKQLLRAMNVPGLTRENVASHLQKYRQSVRKNKQPPKLSSPSRTQHLPGTSKSHPRKQSSSRSLAKLPALQEGHHNHTANGPRLNGSGCELGSHLRAPRSPPVPSSPSSSSSSSSPSSPGQRTVKKRTFSEACR